MNDPNKLVLNFINMNVPVGMCQLGRVVQKSIFGEHGERIPDPKGFGHITGFSYNCFDVLILEVSVGFGKSYPIHSANLYFHHS